MRKTKRYAVVVLGVFFGLVLFQPVTADQAVEKEAFKAANFWLALVDRVVTRRAGRERQIISRPRCRRSSG